MTPDRLRESPFGSRGPEVQRTVNALWENAPLHKIEAPRSAGCARDSGWLTSATQRAVKRKRTPFNKNKERYTLGATVHCTNLPACGSYRLVLYPLPQTKSYFTVKPV